MKLQKDIVRLGSWARKWDMRFQAVKCNMMQLTKKNLLIKSRLLIHYEKYLGVTITNDLKWNTHNRNVCTNANRTIGFLRRTLFSCTETGDYER